MRRRLHPAGGQHESFRGTGIRRFVFARFVGAVPLAADQADRADPAGGCPRYFGASHRPAALRAGRAAGGRGKPAGLERQYRDGSRRKVPARRLHARAARRQHDRDQPALVQGDADRSRMPPAATAASTSSRWRCSSSARASTSYTCLTREALLPQRQPSQAKWRRCFPAPRALLRSRRAGCVPLR